MYIVLHIEKDILCLKVEMQINQLTFFYIYILCVSRKKINI